MLDIFDLFLKHQGELVLMADKSSSIIQFMVVLIYRVATKQKINEV